MKSMFYLHKIINSTIQTVLNKQNIPVGQFNCTGHSAIFLF